MRSLHPFIVAIILMVTIHSLQAQQWQYNSPNAYFNGGNVGIGTTSPSFSLDVQGNAGIRIKGGTSGTEGIVSIMPTGITGHHYYGGTNNGSMCSIFGTDFSANTSSFSRLVLVASEDINTIVASGQGTYGPKPIAFGSYADANATYTEFMRMTTSGHVGIGTATPTSRLRIEWGAGSAYMLNSNTGLGDLWGFTGANGYNFTINSFTPSAGNLKTVLGVNYSVNGEDGSRQYVRNGLKKAPVILMDADNGSLSIYGESGSGGNFRTPTLNLGIAVTSNGMVGVGSASPTEKLDVSGNVKATGYMLIGATSLPAADAKLAVNGNIYSKKVKVTQSGWADYVFNVNYRLRPLSEVEQYIQQHHHLPEVPSAAEVEKNGVDLGDNQVTLLKKIEELTLYVIEQNKQLQQLTQKLEQQQREMEALKKKP